MAVDKKYYEMHYKDRFPSTQIIEPLNVFFMFYFV